MSQLPSIITALVTPFHKGDICWESFHKLVEFQLDNGVEGFVLNGTTGESPNLEASELRELYKVLSEKIKGKAGLVLGTGSSSTQKTLNQLKEVNAWASIDAHMVVVPPYNRPPQQGLVEHFELCAQVSEKPVILYNVPSRTGTSLSQATVVRLSKNSNIVGIKEASGDVSQGASWKKSTENFKFWTGDDGTAFEFFSKVEPSVISVATHIVPGWFVKAAKNESINVSIEDQGFFWKALYAESNPIGIKAALKMMGLIRSDELRLPMVSMSEEAKAKLETILNQLGVLP